MHELIESVEISLDHDGHKVDIVITDTEGNVQEDRSSVTNAGTFRFSYIHPEDDKKYSYNGVFHDKRNLVVLYPIIGSGVISHKPLPYNIKKE